MKSVLVTGADGFVGRFLVARLRATGWRVRAGVRPGRPIPDAWAGDDAIAAVPCELTDDESLRRAGRGPLDAVVHLAAVASGAEARQDPATAWTVNAAGTARLLHSLAAARDETGGDPLVLLVSTAEVYGAGPAGEVRRRREDDPVAPVSPYGASKAGAELAGWETWRRSGLRVVVARPFPHTGPGQAPAFVAPAFARRLRDAARSGAVEVATGNLEPVRDLLDVRDVAEAYRALLDRGEPGQAYNVASGRGLALSELFTRLATLVGVAARPVPDPALRRRADIPHLVGDPTKLRAATGWQPMFTLDQTLRDLVDAQTD